MPARITEKEDNTLIENGRLNRTHEDFGATIPFTEEEEFVKGIYTLVDEAIVRGLERLRRKEGTVPKCRLGCSHCCRFHIPMSIAEAHALSQYVKREFSTEQMRTLRMRTLQWHEWDGSQPGRHPSARVEGQTDLSGYEHCCPLLVNGACSAYPVRPVVCRTHFVASHPWYCHAANDPDSSEEDPSTLASLLAATRHFSTAIEDHIRRSGLDFSRSVMLLPHWLAIQMGWDFALTDC